MSLAKVIIYEIINKSLEDLGMYFYSLEADFQDRALELNQESLNLMRVAELQESLIENNVCMNVDVAILKGMNAALPQQDWKTKEFRLPINDRHSVNALQSNLINSEGNVRALTLSEPTQIKKISASVAKSLSMQELQKSPIIQKIDQLFSDFVGMSHLKEEVYRQASFIKIQQIRKANNIAVAASPSRHMVFKGNPGTGKTTIARVIADIYHELGVLDTKNVVETDRSGLVAEYLGQTAIKTRAVIESAIGGVLFIDEAYSLSEQSNDYGSEAIDMLLKMMEDYRDNLIVIVAGYGDQMDRFISSNPGLNSRFNRYMNFPDYSEEELWEILMKLCKANSYIIQDPTLLKKMMLMEFKKQKIQQGEYFGNARYVRNQFEKSIENQSYRLIKESLTDFMSLQILTCSDFFH